MATRKARSARFKAPALRSAARSNIPPIAFTRADWRALTGFPLSTCNELVSTGLLRSVKIGRRRGFVYSDVAAWFEQLAASGKVIQPRKLYNQRKAGR